MAIRATRRTMVHEEVVEKLPPFVDFRKEGMMTLINHVHRPAGHTVAIDPGRSGAVAAIRPQQGLTIQRDFRNWRDMAWKINSSLAAGDHIVMETVGARPGQGVCSMFSFGRADGVARGCLHTAALHIGVRGIYGVAPHLWKGYYRALLAVPKGRDVDGLEIARRVWPEAPYWARAMDHNSADAALIALWFDMQIWMGNEVEITDPLASPVSSAP